MDKNMKSKITFMSLAMLILLIFLFRLPKKLHKHIDFPEFSYLGTHANLNFFVNPFDETIDETLELPEKPENPESEKTEITEEMQSLIETYGNEDIVGWLRIPDTTIDYPVLQSYDNEYYLHRDMDKNYYYPGSIYMDYENNVALPDKNTIIYGHNMNADTMFHSLRYFRDYDYYLEHPYIELKTLYDTYVYEVFAFYDTHISFQYITVNFAGDSHFEEMLTAMKQKSLYDTGVEVTAKDRIISLSTCTNINEDDRYVLNGKLISINGKNIEEYEAELAEYEFLYE